MPALISHVDVAVIGAGAAGIAAGIALRRAGGTSFVVLEARTRVGGRAWTIDGADGHPLDLGCEWLHSADDNVLVKQAQLLKLSLEPSRPRWRLGASDAVPWDYLTAERAHATGLEALISGRDRAIADFLAPDAPWTPLLSARCAWSTGGEPERVSARDTRAYVDTGANWRLPSGYGRLIEQLARDLPIVLATRVEGIDHVGATLRLSTNKGELSCQKVIVTVPTALIAGEHIRFSPALPDKRQAAASLPLGLADKLVFALDDDLPEQYFIGAPERRATMNYQVRPLGRSRLQCFFAGDLADDLERGGLGAMTDFAKTEIAALLGSKLARRIRPTAASFWRKDRYARGAYAYAKVGCANARALLFAPVDERLFFAGEACSARHFSTAHGAFETGEVAAEAVLTALRRDGRSERQASSRLVISNPEHHRTAGGARDD